MQVPEQNLEHNLHAKYHDLSSKDSPDILFTRLLYCTKCQSRKRKTIQSNIYRILQNVNQVIYTFVTICEPNMMTLAQAVLQMCCSQSPLWVKCLSLKRGIIKLNFDRIVWKVNQVIYIMYPNCMAYIKILAQALLQIFCSGCFTTQNAKVETGK